MTHLRVVGPSDNEAPSPGQVVPGSPPDDLEPDPTDSIRTTDGDLIQLRSDGHITLVVGRFEHAQRILRLNRDQARRLADELCWHLEYLESE